MSKQQPTSFEATASSLLRLFPHPTMHPSIGREPASNNAVVFAAIIQSRAIDRLTKAVERNTRAVMLAGKMDPEDGCLLDSPKWGQS